MADSITRRRLLVKGAAGTAAFGIAMPPTMPVALHDEPPSDRTKAKVPLTATPGDWTFADAWPDLPWDPVNAEPPEPGYNLIARMIFVLAQKWNQQTDPGVDWIVATVFDPNFNDWVDTLNPDAKASFYPDPGDARERFDGMWSKSRKLAALLTSLSEPHKNTKWKLTVPQAHGAPKAPGDVLAAETKKAIVDIML